MSFDINQRILTLRKNLKLSQTDFGKPLGVSRGVIKNIDENVVDASTKPLLIQQICKEFNVDKDWLLTGEGEMFLPQDEEDELLEFALEMSQNKDLNWIRQLNLTLMSMSPEELAAVEKFAQSWLHRMNPKEKEQE